MDEITLPAKELNQALAGLSRVVSHKTTLPGLQAVKLSRTFKGLVSVSATDLDTFAMGMIVSLDGTSIETNRIWCNVISARTAFVPKTIIKTGVAAGSHTLALTGWDATTTDADDSFNATVQELPY